VQYTSQTLFETCEELGVLQSMGRTGVCWDNAMAESFWATLKTEFYDRRFWPTRAEDRREVARWNEIVYNRRRLHSSLDYASPVAIEKAIEHGQVATEDLTDQSHATGSTANDLRASPPPRDLPPCREENTHPRAVPPPWRGTPPRTLPRVATRSTHARHHRHG